MLRYKEFILESKRDDAFTFDNFEDKSNGISFPEIEDIDMYLQLIEDDGYKYTIDKYINENNPRHYIDGPEDNYFNFRVIIINSGFEHLEFIKSVQMIYELFNEKYSNDWNLIAKSHYNGVKIEMKYKEPIKTIDIYKNFQNDINNLLKTNNISFNSKSHIDYNDHYLL
jgi:acid stress-induced BolA-like protein IbaG/YrbA